MNIFYKLPNFARLPVCLGVSRNSEMIFIFGCTAAFRWKTVNLYDKMSYWVICISEIISSSVIYFSLLSCWRKLCLLIAWPFAWLLAKLHKIYSTAFKNCFIWWPKIIGQHHSRFKKHVFLAITSERIERERSNWCHIVADGTGLQKQRHFS